MPTCWSEVGAASARRRASRSWPSRSRTRSGARLRPPVPSSTPAGTRTPRRSARPARPSRRSSTSRSVSPARSSTRSACRARRASSRSTRTRTRRSSSSPIWAWWATCTRSSPSSLPRSRRRRAADPVMSLGIAPIEFPPPVDSEKEFIGGFEDAEDERIEVGVAIVGGGPAGLACANRLMQLLADDESLMEQLGEVPVALIEKGRTPGSHLMSGAMMHPSAMKRLFPDMEEKDWPTFGPVAKDRVYFMTRKRAVPLLPTPPPFRNHGNHVTSIAQLGRFLGQQAEDAGVYVLPETAAYKLIVEDGRVRGVRTGDKGLGPDGKPLGNFEPGSDVQAQVTVLAEGTQGHLTGAAIKHFQLGSGEPQQWELGVKEVWEVKKPLDRVIHSMGWPLRLRAKYREFGGSFVYPMGEDKVSIGFVAGLDYRDATFSVHDVLQEFKTHPMIQGILEGGKRVAWGAKTLPSGGYWAMPRLSAPGMVMLGDAAGMVNVPKLKGIHLAMHAGMYAAEAIFDALKTGSTDDLSAYDAAIRGS